VPRFAAFEVALLAPLLAAGACAPVSPPAPAPVAGAPGATAPAWARAGVCYEIFVRSFADSDGDGVGDLNGVIAKLDYLNDGSPARTGDLGVNCIWLMPVTESPSYHGYDVADYRTIDREYGSNEDFRRLVAEAHRRGMRVLIDMVLNHVSSEYPAFRAALADPASPFRDWFSFRPTHPGVRNLWGGDSWHRSPIRDEYYYGFFWQGMPDLNVENPAVRAELMNIATFWLREMGVDGFRLDAVKFLVEEGDRVQDTPGTHAFLRAYGAHVRQTSPDAYTVGEVFDSTGPLLGYYPDQLDGHFAFEVADSILAAVNSGSAKGLLAPVLRLQAAVPAWRWSPFLRNHDQTRTLTFLHGDVAGARAAATLLLTFPGLPFIYYGEEIGMTGDKPDERIRTPMQWDASPGAGFTSGTPWEPLQPDWQRTNVAAQDADSASLLNLYRRLIRLRAQHPALGATARLQPLSANTDGVAAYLRREGTDAVLVVANVGRTPVVDVALASAAAALPPGRYTVTSLLDAAAPAPLVIGSGGAVRGYIPLRMLAPLAVHVFSLAAAPGDRP